MTPATAVRTTAMRAHHLPEVVAIERVVQRQPWGEAVFAAELAAAGRRYLVAVADGVARRPVIGYAGAVHVLDEVHLTTVAVTPDARRRGVAATLVRRLLSDAAAEGASAATLEVRAGNAAAIALYEGLGFAAVGVRAGYYPPDGEDAVIMWSHELPARGAVA